MEKAKVTDRINVLEEALLKLDFVDGSLKILAAAFEDSGSFSRLNPEDVEKAVSGISAHVREATNKLDSVLDSLMKEGGCHE